MVKNKKQIKIVHEPTVNYTFTGSKNIMKEENADTANKTASNIEKEIPRGRSIGNPKIRQKNRIGAEHM